MDVTGLNGSGSFLSGSFEIVSRNISGEIRVRFLHMTGQKEDGVITNAETDIRNYSREILI